MTSEDAYFYDVDGSQVPLRSTSFVAVHWPTAESAGVPALSLTEMKEHSTELRGGHWALPAADIPADVAGALDEAGALEPVYSASDGAWIVVLPEVRVELADETQRAGLDELLASAPAEVVRDAGDRMVVRPATNRGADALELANTIEERVHPTLSQARFIRVVPRPGAEPRGPKP